MEKQFRKIPLAHALRPKSLEEFVGQEHLVGMGKPIRKMIESPELFSSIIFWGPTGCGKTTLARLISRLTNSDFVEISAVNAGKEDMQKAVSRSRLNQTRTILFIDEIHRFNKSQQDFLLPHVEKGEITLIGATTENPSFEIISALLSRLRVFVLNSLTEKEIEKIIKNAINSEEVKKSNISINDENIKLISQLANGDARSALNILEISIYLSREKIEKEDILEAAQKTHLRYDKNGEEHYNIISALHKSMRDSDVDASIYWTMRMVEAGEDPKYIIRRMIRFASEDIGNADPQALVVSIAAKQAIEFLGYPECSTALVQTAIYLAKAPKSNAVYESINRAKIDIERTGNLSVPLHLRNAPTKLMKDLAYGEGYKYAHDYKYVKIDQEHFPLELKGRKYYNEKRDKIDTKKN